MRPSVRTYLVNEEGERVFGPGPAELLRRIRECGSLRAASMSMGMAYTKALALVRTAEKGLGSPLTTRVVGGAGGGGSTPTPEADALLAAYERWTASVNSAAGAQFDAAFPHGAVAVSSVGADSVSGDDRVVGAAMLAAGHSVRYGKNKLVEPLLGEPVVARAIDCVPAGMPIVVVSATPEVDAIADARGIERVRPDGFDEDVGATLGQSASVRAAAAFARDAGWDACLFLPGDQPLVEHGSVTRMLGVSALRPEVLVRLSWRGRPASPVLFPSNFYEALSSVEGDAGGSSAVGEGDVCVSVEASLPWELWDIDTPDDLRRAREILESGLGRGGSCQ
ncbi:NTP transferase domain-containing protein [uncultured Parolsenella sp.]|uniref:NTP transferase domain-containing protein n=1 Tax=uncultured Parolsenella sp. TaxID=2083008 RepID=UPI0025DE23B4|nr:NTP transferase domain-containing protein [uncultured Parolsenella sp.]